MALIAIVTPAPPGSRHGNRVSAVRWEVMLRGLGHEVRVEECYSGDPCDLLIALHAVRSHESLSRFRATWPERPLFVVLTGTDIYGDLAGSFEARESLAMADSIVCLQEEAVSELPAAVRDKAVVIYQSADVSSGDVSPVEGFQVCLLAHLREVKNTALLPRALRHLPERSRISVVHMGKAPDESQRLGAQRWDQQEPRYRWVGDVPHAEAMAALAASRLLVVTSRHEGAANAISEALACGVPILSTRIAGAVGMLGEDYCGLYESDDERGLVDLLQRCEDDAAFLAHLKLQCLARAPLVDPAREVEALRSLLARFALS